LSSQAALSQFLSRCKDPVFFARHMLGVELHDGQKQWLQNSVEPINCLLPGNRWGKSTVEAVKHLHKCFTKDGHKGDSWQGAPYNTISVSVSADQAEIIFSMAKRMVSAPAIAPFVKRVYKTPFPTIVFLHGSEFTCRSAHDDGKYIDGHRYDYVSIDEAGWIPDLKKLLNGVVLMRLAGGGELDLVGTPKGRGDFFWYANRGLRGMRGYYAQRGTTFENIYLPKADLKRREELLRQADPRLRDQVLYGAFVAEEGLSFTEDQLDNLFEPLMPESQPREPGHTYVQAWDLGRKSDWTVGFTIDVTRRPWQVVDFQRLNKVPWEEIYNLIDQKAKEYGVWLPRIDATGPQGDVIEEELWKRGRQVEAFRISTGAVKLNLVNRLQAVLDDGRSIAGWNVVPVDAGEITVPVLDAPREGNWGLLRSHPYPSLVDEMASYSLDDRNLTQDTVMALAMAVDLAYGGDVAEPVIGGLFPS
jgi:hypothetical protein